MPTDRFRIAAYNVENLFSRPRAMSAPSNFEKSNRLVSGSQRSKIRSMVATFSFW
jgi:hypothetical protein